MVGMQVDDQVGFGDFFTEGSMNTAVHRQLVVLQVEPGKQLIFGKGVVGDEHALAQCLWHRLVLLMVAAEQEKELGLKRQAVAILVKTRQKRIFLKHFQQHGGVVEFVLQQAGQRGFAHTNDPFNGDKFVFHGLVQFGK